MNDLTPFDYSGRPVRVVLRDGEPWFVATDVCAVLGYAHTSSALRSLRDNEKGVSPTHTPGGEQRLTVISEPGLYRLIMRSNRSEAEAFQDWVTTEVLPTIRRTGSYGVPAPRELSRLELIDLAREAEVGRLAAEQRVAELAPKAETWDALASAEGDYSLREAAQILDRDPAISTGQNRLARYLREIGWCDKQGMPYQRHVDCGRLAVRARSYDHPRTGEEQVARQVRVTAKGVEELRKLLAPAPLRLVSGGAS